MTVVEEFFRHRCDIYRHTDVSDSPGYGLPNSLNKMRTYPEMATLTGLPCLFAFNQAINAVSDDEPQNEYRGANELCVSSGTAILPGDKVIDLRYGIAYTAGFPEDIRGDYLSVPLYRTTEQVAL